MPQQLEDPRRSILEIIGSKLNRDPDTIKDSDTLVGDLGADSLDLADIEMALEENIIGADGNTISLKEFEPNSDTTIKEIVEHCRKQAHWDWNDDSE